MHCSFCKIALLQLVAVIGISTGQPAGATGSLRTYNVDARETSVSGVSSGAAMAVQLDVAFSSTIKGAGVIAGVPYSCAHGSLATATSACMNASIPIDVAGLVRLTKKSARLDEIDGVANLDDHRIWLFSGDKDSVVRPSVADDLEGYYKALVKNANVAHVRKANAEHAMPTEAYGNPCPVKGDPYISDCDYDAAGGLLRWIYGDLIDRAAGPLHGRLTEFDQTEFIANPAAHGMASTGWVFVPENCRAQQRCRLHVALHGCRQFPGYRYVHDGAFVTFGRTFAEHAGYNEWAETNSIIVLYPQAQRSPQSFFDFLDTLGRNPNGCWDWWGYDDAGYARRTGSQMAAIKKMIDRIANGH